MSRYLGPRFGQRSSLENLVLAEVIEKLNNYNPEKTSILEFQENIQNYFFCLARQNSKSGFTFILRLFVKSPQPEKTMLAAAIVAHIQKHKLEDRGLYLFFLIDGLEKIYGYYTLDQITMKKLLSVVYSSCLPYSWQPVNPRVIYNWYDIVEKNNSFFPITEEVRKLLDQQLAFQKIFLRSVSFVSIILLALVFYFIYTR